MAESVYDGARGPAVFKGTPEEVRTWLSMRPIASSWVVRLEGGHLVAARGYLEMAAKEPKPVSEEGVWTKWANFFNSLTLVEQRKLAEQQPAIQVPDEPLQRRSQMMLADSVLNNDRVTVFMGMPNDVAEWLKDQDDVGTFTIKVGVTSKEFPVSEYLAAAKFAGVRELVQIAMTRQDVCTRNGDQKPADRFLDEVTRMIIELL